MLNPTTPTSDSLEHKECSPANSVHTQGSPNTQAVAELTEALRLAKRAIMRSDNIALSYHAVAEIEVLLARYGG